MVCMYVPCYGLTSHSRCTPGLCPVFQLPHLMIMIRLAMDGWIYVVFWQANISPKNSAVAGFRTPRTPFTTHMVALEDMTSFHCKNSLIRCLREPHAICTVLSPLFRSSLPFSCTSSSDFRPDIKVDEFTRSGGSAGSLQLRVSYILPISYLILILWWSLCEGISSHFLPKPGDMTIRQWKENFEIFTVLYLLSLSARCCCGDVPPSPTGGKGASIPRNLPCVTAAICNDILLTFKAYRSASCSVVNWIICSWSSWTVSIPV